MNSATRGRSAGLAEQLLISLVLLAACPMVRCEAATDAANVDFQADVAPILEQHCLRCHSDEEAKGDVSLSSLSGLLASESVVMGDPEASYLLDLLTPSDGVSAEMPKEAKPLTSEQIQVIRNWIAQGAAWPENVRLTAPDVADLQWWSLQPIASPLPLDAPQEVAQEERSEHPVDAFIDARLLELGLAPVAAANPRDLIRRITYDLTGLPPTPSEVDAFLQAAANDAEQAWTAVVDRLLASPAFGEKWGQHWLDVARYAETHGYDKDQPRPNAWPYRDYVIRSLNEDKPYGRFAQEQVAGDVLYPGDPDGVLGLGFLAAGPWDFIGHVEVGEGKLDGRIAKHLDRDEMVATVFNVFMSTTVQCAQCHHHKFDPIRMRDYYQLHAVFAAVDRADRVYQGLSPEQMRKQQSLTAQLQALQQEVRQARAEVEQQIAEQAMSIDQRIAELTAGLPLEPQPEYGYHSQIAAAQDTLKWVQVDLGEPRSLSQVRLFPAFDTFANIGAGFGFPARYLVQAGNDPQFLDDSVHTLLAANEEDQRNPKSRIVTAAAGDRPYRYLRVTATKLGLRQNDFIFALAELQALDSSGTNHALHGEVSALDSIEAPVRWGAKNLTDGIYHQRVSDPNSLDELIGLEAERANIEREFHTPAVTTRLAEAEKIIGELQRELDQFPAGEFVYAAATQFPSSGQFIATDGKPRSIHLLQRGDLRSPAEAMLPGAPPLWGQSSEAFAEQSGWSESAARAGLAEHLTRPDNPLTWRTMANRVWQWTFGQPLVGTPNDFGRMGMAPSHPRLLDYLAARLRDDPRQSIKSLVRLLVTSRAYRRASEHNAANATIDANNAYWWRANRRRLTAEEFRDTLLAVSGALRLDERGGPSFRDFVVEKPEHSPHYQYHLHDPDDSLAHRRSIYRFVVRSQPQPMLTALDCADPSISVPMRDESTTALQALTQWNNRFVEAMSRRLAQRLEAEAPADVEQRVGFACQLTLGRGPTESERAVLEELLSNHGEETLARVLMNTSAFTYVE